MQRAKAFNADCERPACDDIKSALSQFQAQPIRKSQKVECPPAKDELGRGTWALLHTMAAWYPDEPSKNDSKHMTRFIKALALFYPCTWCASDFQENVIKSPPRVESRKELCVWMCEQHNTVNKKLGKPEFSCSITNLDERWRKSSKEECQN